MLLLYFLSLHQMTPLHVAVERGDRINIIKYLNNKGAAINITDNHGVNIYVSNTKQGTVLIICCLVSHRDANNVDCIILPCHHHLLMFQIYHALKLLKDKYCLKFTIKKIYPSL